MTNPTTPADRYNTGICVCLDFLTALSTNTDGTINKLVTIFADYTRTVYMTDKTSNILQNLLAGDGQDSVKSGLKTCTRICKNCAVPSLHQDTILAKVPRLYLVLRRVTLTNYTAGPLVVMH